MKRSLKAYGFGFPQHGEGRARHEREIVTQTAVEEKGRARVCTQLNIAKHDTHTQTEREREREREREGG